MSNWVCITEWEALLILYSRSCPGALGDQAAYGDLPGSSRLKVFSLDLCGVMRCLWFQKVSEVTPFRDGDAVFRMSEAGQGGRSGSIGCFFEVEGSWLLARCMSCPARAYRSMKDNLPINKPLFFPFLSSNCFRWTGQVESSRASQQQQRTEDGGWAARTASMIDYQREKRVREMDGWREGRIAWIAKVFSPLTLGTPCSSGAPRWILGEGDWAGCSRSGGSGWINRLV